MHWSNTSRQYKRLCQSKRKQASARQKNQKTPTFQGWKTSDQDEIERRRHRGATGALKVKASTTIHPYYGDYLVRSASGVSYEVEIRSLREPINTCGCPDHAVNQLGTCKHEVV